MKFELKALELGLSRGDQTIRFADLTYFWGQMGAGKSSIARLVDYCLGGSIQLSPALQAEFNSAKLTVELLHASLTIERQRDSSNVFASWERQDGPYSVVLPARTAAGEMIPGTGVETLSDLVFWLSGVNPPRVRKSKNKEDSKSVRLSLRDLLWYCYLDQDHIDSEFYNLEENAEFYLKLKSRDVIRYIVGFHDEKVADLEAELDQLRANRIARVASIDSLTRTLAEVGIESEEQVRIRERELVESLAVVEIELEQLRNRPREQQTEHAADELRSRARERAEGIANIDGEVAELVETLERNVRHRNEIEMLSLKFRRSAEAREILSGVQFETCPRCTQNLPPRTPGHCPVCDQEDRVEITDPTEIEALDSDIAARRRELDEAIGALDATIRRARGRRDELIADKARVESDLNRVLEEHDSAYLSMALQKERERAALNSAIESLRWLLRLPRMLEEQRDALAQILALEELTRGKLKDVRQKAEADRANLDRLGEYFLDCLVRAGVPGIQDTDRVQLEPPTFYPAIYGADPTDATVATFTSLSSGGKKTLFKCCFALAIHRVAAILEAPLPELLIIDSPMKNISERENKEQFEGFYEMIYQLKSSELSNTQFILIDKEFFQPPRNLPFVLESRHMKPADDDNPPLIPYYRGR